MASTLKRKRAAENEPEWEEETYEDQAENGVEVDPSLLEALEKAEAAGALNPPVSLDLRGMKKMIIGLEKRLKENLESRMKYADNPEKFAESELDLHDELVRLRALAGAPELYPELVALNTVPSIVGLLGHDNKDIAVDVVLLLQEMTDEDAVEDSVEAAQVLVDALVENNALELLVQNLTRLDEKDPDEANAVHSSLATIENMIDVRPSVAETVCEKTKLLRWLLGRIKPREFDANRQYASEILAILLQSSTGNQKRLGQINGVDFVLQSVAQYKSRDPRSGDEEELLENLFDCMCSLVMPQENKERFLKAEGVELMIIIMKQKKLAYGSALRALDFAMTKFAPACERFVDVLGLKTLFAAFMGKIPVHKKNQGARYKEELEERIVSIVASLFDGLTRGSRRDRLLSKFVENEFEKIDRLMELYMRYADRVKKETERLDQLEIEDLEIDEDEKYIRKLEAGLYTLQLIAVILGHLWYSEHSRMRARIELLLRQQRLSKDNVKAILQEYHDNIGDMDGPEEKERTQSKIQKFIDAM